MPAQPITVQLSKFEQIEILRLEIEARQEELKKTEQQIRECLYEIEKQRYLQTLHPLFQTVPPPENAAHLAQFNAHRESLTEAVQVMEAALTSLQGETAGQTAPPSRLLSRPGGPANPAAGVSAPRRKFDSFDDFKSSRTGG